MAMDKDRLGLALWTRVKTIHGGYTPGLGVTQDAAGLAYWTGIADEIIKEITTHSEILVNAWSAVAPGVVTGADVSSTITGTASGKVSA